MYSHINEAGSGVEVFTDVESLVDVLGEDPASQAVLRHVGSLHHSLHVPGIELAHHLNIFKNSFREAIRKIFFPIVLIIMIWK